MNLLNLSDPTLLNTANNVAISIQVALNTASPQSSRLEANKYCEQFRRQATPCELTSVGLILTCRPEVELISSGMHFLEHVVKYHWTQLQEREEVKERLILLMQNGLPQFPINCPQFIQEALARVIVEIAKREWPQLWPDLISRLCEMSTLSNLPLLVLRRMAEDIFSFQLIDSIERRKELNQGMNAVSDEIISTLYKNLVVSVQLYRTSGQEIHAKRGELCLSSLLPFIEWVVPSSFLKENRIIILFTCLSEIHLKMLAADCLVQLVERRPARKEEKFDIPKVCLEAESCSPLIHSIVNSKSTENDYLIYLRKLGELLSALAMNSSKEHVNIGNLIKCMEALASRKEAVSILGSTLAANQLLKNIKPIDCANGSRESPVTESLIKLLNLICSKFVSSPPCPSEKEDMNRLKSEFSLMIRSIGKLVPKLYEVVNTWLHNSLSSPNQVQLFQWDALVLVLDAVASSVSHEDEETVKIGLRDLELCYTKFDAETSLELKSTILSSVSALFVFLSLAKQRFEFGKSHETLLLAVLQSIFKCFSYDESEREIRRHAAALLIKLATKYPDVMVISFDFLHSNASALAPKLTPMERSSIAEALIITSNAWNDVIRQSAFIGSLLPRSDWEQISVISDTSQTFIEMFKENVFFEKRGLFLTDLTILHSILRRIKKPKSSNSVLHLSASQNSVDVTNTNAANQSRSAMSEAEVSHPAYDHVCPLLPVVFKLVKTIHALIENATFKFIFEMTDQDKAHILGLHYNNLPNGELGNLSTAAADREKPWAEKIRGFVQTIQELCYSILGDCAVVLSPRFYSIPQLNTAYLNFVGWNSQHLSDFRLRGVLRSVFKPYLISCSSAQAPDNVIPFAQSYFPFIFDRLVSRWTMVENSKNTDADGEEEKEVLENSSLRLLTKEYIEIIFRLLDNSAVVNPSSKLHNDGEQMDMDNDMVDYKVNSTGNSSGNPGELGEIGNLLLSDPTCFRFIVQFCVSALCWDDSLVVLKASRCLLLAWNAVSKDTDVVRWIFATSLRAVCLWIDNEANVDGLLRLIDHIFKHFHDKDASFSQVLLEWGATEGDIKRLSELCKGLKNDKKRKELLRKMIHNNPSVEKNKSPKAQWLPGLPNLVIHNQEKILKQNKTEIDLNECFSMIHNK